MAQKKKVSVTDVVRIQAKTPEMESLLQAGYDLTVEKAKEIIAERTKNPAAYPYDEYRKAIAFLAAYESTPKVISTKPGGQFFTSAKEE